MRLKIRTTTESPTEGITKVNISVLGTGRVGGTLGRRWAQRGHQIRFASRDPGSEKVVKLLSQCGPNAQACGWKDAATGCDVVVYAAPWPVAQTILSAIGPLNGKVLIDSTNPLTADFCSLDLGHTTSAGEQIAEWCPGAHVVKAFNNVSSAIMANPVFGDSKATMFYCGDSQQAKATVRDLAAELDFDAVDAGPLKIARYLEPFAMLYIQLAVKEGWGSHCAFKLMKR
jgi:predicted dinucleotide-binding enzyme